MKQLAILGGVKTDKALFDIATGNPNTIASTLDVIGEIIVAFRGPAVRFLTRQQPHDMLPHRNRAADAVPFASDPAGSAYASYTPATATAT